MRVRVRVRVCNCVSSGRKGKNTRFVVKSFALTTIWLLRLWTNIKYPNKARKKGIEGVVYIKFIVNNLGEIEKCKIIKSVDPLLDNEAIRVISEMGKWIPAEMDGEKNSMSFTLPIKFKLQ